jgi:rsbT co-antagonist protein RsbR
VLDKEISVTLSKFGISQEDIRVLAEVGRLLEDDIEGFVDDFYIWMKSTEEYQTYFAESPSSLARVRKLQASHWRSLFKANLDQDYFAWRRHIGSVHARIDLPNDIYCAGMRMSLRTLIERLRAKNLSSENVDAMAAALTKFVFLDLYLVMDEIARIQKEKILEHSMAMMEMATPVTPIWEGILLLPLVGIIDSVRTQDIMNKMLAKIAETRAKVFLMDISGIATVDSAVANQLIKITKATQLMGCESIISGISPKVARTVVDLGVALGEVRTTATLRDGFELALKSTGIDLRQMLQRQHGQTN